jgi:methionyl aminopeptidase
MAIFIKTKEEIDILREGGKRLARVLASVAEEARPGVSTLELDHRAFDLIKELGDEPAFLHYKPAGATSPYPASLCTSVNNEVVHGIPSAHKILQEGDIISLDLGLKHKGMFTDHAITIGVGAISRASEKLLQATREAMMVGIEQAVVGNTVGDIGYAIETCVKGRYGIVRELSGHGVGKKIHEDPFVPNFGRPGRGEKLRAGMVIAIEPMLNIGGDDIVTMPDGYTINTADGSRSAHFEHTVLISEEGPEILTQN